MAGNGAIPAIAAYVPIKPGWQIKKSMARIVMEENRKVHKENPSYSSATSYSLFSE
jgi:hypothetical protein